MLNMVNFDGKIREPILKQKLNWRVWKWIQNNFLPFCIVSKCSQSISPTNDDARDKNCSLVNEHSSEPFSAKLSTTKSSNWNSFRAQCNHCLVLSSDQLFGSKGRNFMSARRIFLLVLINNILFGIPNFFLASSNGRYISLKTWDNFWLELGVNGGNCKGASKK